MTSEVRWPRWTQAAAPMGLRSTLSAPLRARGEATGAIKVYSRDPHSYTTSDEPILQMLADQAGVVPANVEGYVEAGELSEQLKDALRSRDVIGQAKGILMAQEGVDDEAAFAMLRQASQSKNVKLRDIAAAVVETTRRQAPARDE